MKRRRISVEVPEDAFAILLDTQLDFDDVTVGTEMSPYRITQVKVDGAIHMVKSAF